MRYVFGDHQLDVVSFRLTVAGETQHIEPQVFDVLRYLIEHRDRVVTKNELLDEVWGDRFVSESALTSRIKSARRAVGDHGTVQRVIRTVRGRGFQFIVDVDEIDQGGDPHGSGTRNVPARFGAAPRPPTPIIGRGREIDHVLGLLRDVRIVTLLGPGGVGKTRLAVEIAGRVADAFPGGVAYVELDHLVDAAQVPPLVAETLGVPGAPSGIDALAEAVGDQPVLLIVDNFEHVLEAAGFLGKLAAATDHCSILVTSRERLRLAGEVCVDVPPFGVEDDDDALALFERTARSVAADVLLDAAGRDVVVEICRAVDGLPLAIELAAAATRVVPPTMLLRRLHHTLGLAGADYTDRPDRHRTMRQTIDWSVNGLEPLLRELVAHVSLFVAPVPLAAVASVWQRTEDETLAGLATLIDKSLVRAHPAPDDQAWFRMLVPIREYGIDLLEQSGDGDSARRRHANEIARTLSNLEDSRWASSVGHWIDVVRLRAGDIETAYRHARRTADHALANRIAAPLYNYWHRVGHHDQARSWIDESLERDDGTNPVATAMLHLGAGYVTWVSGDLDSARRHWGLALDLWRNEDHDRYVAFCLAHLAGLSIGFDDREEYARSMQLCDEAIAIARRTGERSLLAQCLNIAGELARVAGDGDVARDVYTEALDLLGGAHDHQQRAVVLSNLAALAGDTGEPDEAKRLGVEALRISADRQLWVTAAFCMTQLASAEYDLGRAERGARLLGAADEMLRNQRASRHSGDLPAYERLVERLRTNLDPEHLRELLDVGARLSIPEAIADALDDPVRRSS